MNFTIQIKPLNNEIEKFVCKKINLQPPESYAKMNEQELENIYNLVITNFPNEQIINFKKEIILSIRANLMRDHMIIRHKNITKNKNNIIKNYEEGMDIIELVKKYDASPLNLLRLIFHHKYKTKLTVIIKNTI
jgi:Mor family transcriptional regulator